MDSLPPELLSQILLYLPRTSYPAARGTCIAFNEVLAPELFAPLQGFLDLRAAENRLAKGANNPLLRPVTIWSPESWPPANFALDNAFLSALYSGLMHESWALDGAELDGESFKGLVGLDDLTGSKLRQIQYLYKMYLEYVGSVELVPDSNKPPTLETVTCKLATQRAIWDLAVD